MSQKFYNILILTNLRLVYHVAGTVQTVLGTRWGY